MNPILLTLAALGLAALVDRRRWWLVGIPALLGLATGFMVDAIGASVHDVPLVPIGEHSLLRGGGDSPQDA